jgi:hypothetical protein
MGGDAGDRQKLSVAAPPAQEPASDSSDQDCVIVDLSRINFNVSEKWRTRLKDLDDYQRAAPFVFGRLTLG